MALHGDVSVNRQPILFWSARRLTPELTERNEYEVEVFEYASAETTRFKVSHKYEDGAATLAATVLRQFNYRKAGVP